MNRSILALSLFSVLALASCNKQTLDADQNNVLLNGKLAPEGFDFSTTKNISIEVQLLSRDNKPVSGVLTSFYLPTDITKGAEIAKSVSSADGKLSLTVTIPTYINEIVVDPAYVGLLREVTVKLNASNRANLIIGGATGYVGDIVVQKSLSSVKSPAAQLLSSDGVTYHYDKSQYDALGRPLNLVPDNSVNLVELMKEINASLPERKDGIYLHPEYIAAQTPSNLNIGALSDVWITFVHEGANYRNALAYYTYPSGNKPAKVEDIKDIHLVFPNASLKGHIGEGNMLMGDKVKIGRFPAGTSIGFVLIQNAYKDDGSLNTANTKFYSDEQFNLESDFALKRHNVLLYSKSQKVFLVGFEDMRRDNSQADNDFNDLVFFAQTNPVDAIDPTDIPYLEDKVTDSDGDGVPDVLDEFPNDPERAYTRYYPSKDVWGTLVFEDQWPSEGDYDFNDLVVSYRYKFIMNSSNKVKDVIGNYVPLASGATFRNGFGVEFPFDASVVKSSTGYKHTANYIQLNGKGLEEGHTKAVIVPFDNVKSLFKAAATYVNTINGNANYKGDSVNVTTTFLTSEYEANVIAKVPFNPFLISNVNRGKEVHLVNNKPTSLANTSLLGTSKDASNPAQGKYYLTSDNRPFALNFIGEFNYPVESVNIQDTYNHFKQWANSGGSQYKDWYLMKSGYVNNNNIYKK